MSEKRLSTTALSKKYGLSSKEMFQELLKRELIEKTGDNWTLTQKGLEAGGRYIKSKQYGTYITWPDNLELDISVELITATALGKHFGLSANKINYILSELGWIQKGLKGWKVTKQGKKVGGVQDEDKKSGIPYVRWPSKIVESKILQSSVNAIKGTKDFEQSNEDNTQSKNSFREKFSATYRATDGHFVRSKAEMIIDNWLYMAEIVHAYERKLPIEEEVYSDFYIPTGKVYIEFWGYDNDKKYLKRKKAKQEIYKKYGFNLIELTDEDVLNLDDILPRLLLKYGVQAY